MTCFSRISDGAEGDDREYAFQQHAAVSDRLCIRFLIQLLRRRAGGYERVEARDRAAGYGREKDREHVLYAIAIVYRKAGVSREKVRLDIRMGAYDAYDSDSQHRIEQEGRQVVTRLEQDPDRSDGGDGDVETDEPHPCGGGEIQRMPVHADRHAGYDRSDAQDGGGHHGGVTAIYSKSEYDSNKDEEERYHSDRSLCRTLGFI